MISATTMHAGLDRADVDVLVATSRENVFYTTGLKILMQWDVGWAAYSLWAADATDPALVYPNVDSSQVVAADVGHGGRYPYGEHFYSVGSQLSAADEELKRVNDETPREETAIDALLTALADLTPPDATVAIERRGLDDADYRRVKRETSAARILPADELLTDLRTTKSEWEIDRLQRATEITEAAIERTIETVTAGMTEAEFTKRMHKHMIDGGATRLNHVDVGFGAHGAWTHSTPYIEYGGGGGTELEDGDLITIDTGCVYGGYASDIGRTYAFGTATREQELKYDIVRSTNDLVIERCAAGEDVAEIFTDANSHARRLGEKHGIEQFESFERHHFGHGIGVETYDPPIIGPESHDLRPGMVLNAETPYKELGTGMFQCEDTFVIRENDVERFSRYPESLQVVG